MPNKDTRPAHDSATQINLLLAALLELHEEQRRIGSLAMAPAHRHRAAEARATAERIESRIEHATGWSFMAIEGNDDVADADGAWADYAGGGS